MSIFDVFKFKSKTKAENTDAPVDEVPDEEFQLPELKIGEFKMTDELRRRRENEALLKKYNLQREKSGEFI